MAERDNGVVRRKASQRKRRTETGGIVARRPTQKRSLERFQLVLQATERLLETANIEDISFYDIARVAELPPASVHYLFPTMASVRIELNRVYNARMSEYLHEWGRECSATGGSSWQDRTRILAARTREHFNAHRPLCEVLFGPVLHRESRLANSAANDAIAASSLDDMCRAFVVPEIPGLVDIFITNCEIVDALWSRSYLLHGSITADALDEAVEVQIACLRRYLPEILPLRSGPSQGNIRNDT